MTMGRIDLADRLEDARARIDGEQAPTGHTEPRFARMARKDARIRVDQDAALTALARSLMRQRRVKAERITENTLIRVAIDLLLAHADELRGSTENELRDGIITALPHSRTSTGRASRSSGVPELPTTDVRDTRTSGPRQARTPHSPQSGTSGMPTVGAGVASARRR
ncbi:hypothetical protein GCM10022240_06070 [Microbacterium kribbense]|uniref:Uncharacterized protein n=1 Tax=Microbacterium kribbense TaxID=433645 RepID=A0ABP7G8W5_9MICO